MSVPVSCPRALVLAACASAPLLGCLDWSSSKRTGADDAGTADSGDEGTLGTASEGDAQTSGQPEADAPDFADAGETASDAGETASDAGETASDAGETASDAGDAASNSDACPATACDAPYTCKGNAANYTCQGQYADFPLPNRRSRDDFATQGLRVERLVVHDDVTGLMWPREALSLGLTWPDAVTACTESRLGGYDDWRLPSIHELVTLLGSERALDISSSAFVGLAGDDYWTSSLDSESLDFALGVRMYQDGWVFSRAYNLETYFQCVRSERITYSGAHGARFVSEANAALVHDTRTKLYWEARVSATRTAMAYQDAVDYCATLSLGQPRQFRLPSLAELYSVIDFARSPGMRLPSMFINASDLNFWSRSLGPADADPPFALTVHSYGTLEGSSLTAGRNAVRCVSPEE